jgi:hypothetical protein
VVFTQLMKQFDIDEKVIEYFIDTLRLSTLEDFHKLFVGPEEVPAIIANVKDITIPLQVSRVRQAWDGLDKASKQSETLRKRGLEQDDMDSLLPRDDLDNLLDVFWDRYHIKHHVSIEPSDLLVSRCSKRLNKRLLVVDDLWGVKSLKHQARAKEKKIKIADNLQYTESQQMDDISVPHTLFAYLGCLQTYMLAWARAGCSRLEDAPEKEARATTSTTVVHIPLDITTAYYERALRQACKMLTWAPEGRTLEWLIMQDEEDRGTWVDEMRHSNDTLGTIIKDTMVKRDASWTPNEPQRSSGGGSSAGSGSQSRQTPVKQNQEQRKPVSLTPGAGAILASTKGGVDLCSEWNTGGCTAGKQCAKNKKHACNQRLKNGRACAMTNHRSKDCRNPKRQ